jgi:NAD(P)-dependent dehydrogenase (short-subunit alcohol dehydrogenase family)
MRPNGKWVLVTGATTGIGYACVRHLAKLGYQVIAGYRKDTDEDRLEGEFVWPLKIDVTHPDDIARAAEEIETLVDDGLCGIVNNAGVGFIGPVEFVSIDSWRKQFEVNVFGQVAITQIALPLLRKHVAEMGKGAARIIMIGSIGGKVGQPVLSPYCSSKFALEAICDALRLELREQGIQTILLEPGAIKSEIWRKGQESADEIPRDHPARLLYGDIIEGVTTRGAQSAKEALPAIAVARVVEACLTKNNPKARYVIGRDANIAAILKRVLPDRAWDAIMMKAFGL